MNSATGTKKTVGFGKALVVFICVFALILCGINVLGTSAHIPLVIATIISASRAFRAALPGMKWKRA